MAERSHLVRMHVKNIGCIGNVGLSVELDDIVCLVGANNAGKTTVLRAYELAVKQLELKPDGFSVLHDIDSPKTKDGGKGSPAYSINKNIAEAVLAARAEGISVIYRCSCPNFEQHHEMKLPKKDKPYESWRAVRDVEAIRNSVLDVLKALTTKPADAALPPEDGTLYETHLKAWVSSNAITEKAYQFD